MVGDKNLCKKDRACLERFEDDLSAGKCLIKDSEFMETTSWIDPTNPTTRDMIFMQVVGEYINKK